MSAHPIGSAEWMRDLSNDDGLSATRIVFSHSSEPGAESLLIPPGTPLRKVYDIFLNATEVGPSEALRTEISARMDLQRRRGGPDPHIVVVHTCASPGCQQIAVSMKQCGRCRAVRYCSQECQTVHWKRGHRQVCRPRASKK
jgi:hypothetical protein